MVRVVASILMGLNDLLVEAPASPELRHPIPPS